MVLVAVVEAAGGDAMGLWQADATVVVVQHPQDRLQRSRIRSVCILLALTTLQSMPRLDSSRNTRIKRTGLALKPSDASAN